jgi:hypothetical protein
MDIVTAREILWDDAKELSNEELQMAIDLIQAICSIVIEDYLSERDWA